MWFYEQLHNIHNAHHIQVSMIQAEYSSNHLQSCLPQFIVTCHCGHEFILFLFLPWIDLGVLN